MDVKPRLIVEFAAHKGAIPQRIDHFQLLVPDVRKEAFVFAKSTLADDGFAWRVVGKVHGYASNTVIAQ